MKHTNTVLKGIKAATAVLMFFYFTHLHAQSLPDLGNLTGNFQFDGQLYFQDTLIGAPNFRERIGSNSFLNLLYSRGKFSAGARYEAYYPTQQGFTRKTGSGIPYRFIRYSHEKFDITAGTFYEQFGSGMILRSYEEWGLGFDNTIDGIRMKFMGVKGLSLTGLIGKQRNAFAFNLQDLSEGIIRAFDADWSVNESFGKLTEAKSRLRIGFSALSRYQADFDPIQIFPENVAAFAGRANFNRGNWNVNAEYAYKINDPSTVNSLIYKPGNGFLLQASYSQKGLGISAAIKRIDNMDIRSDRNATGNNLNLNFLPPQTKQHTYRLPTLFVYATQPLGEVGMQAEALYKIKKGTALGGKYGTTIGLNFSRITGLSKTPAADPDMGYEAAILPLGKLYFQDINLEIVRKFSDKFKAQFSDFIFTFDHDLFKQLSGFSADRAHIQVLEMSFKLKPKHSLRTEVQHAFVKGDLGNWAMLLLEYSIAPKWFVAAFDEYNYSNAEEKKRLHYFSGQLGYRLDSYRVTLGYGRQRAGVLCVGGVCRTVPAANGITLSVVGNF